MELVSRRPARDEEKEEDRPTPSVGGESDETGMTSMLETIGNSRMKYPPKRSLWTLFGIYALNGAASTVIFATVSEYTAQLTEPENANLFAGLVLGLPYLVGAACSYPWHLFRNRFGYRYTFFAFCYINVVVFTMYGLALLAQSPVMLLLSRVVLGVTNNYNVFMDYVTLTAGVDVTSRVLFEWEVTFCVGYAVGPFISFLLSLLSNDIAFFDTQLILTTSTLPGWFMAVAWFFSAALVLALVTEPTAQDYEDRRALVLLGEENAEAMFDDDTSERESVEDRDMSTPSAGGGGGGGGGESSSGGLPPGRLWNAKLCISVTIFITALSIAGVELFSEIKPENNWGWSVTQTSIYLTCLFGGFIPVSIYMGTQAHKIEDRLGWVVGALASVLFLLFIYPFTSSLIAEIILFTIGAFGILSAMSSGRSFTWALSSKLLDPREVKDGHRFQTVNNTAHQVGRGVGFVLAKYLESQIAFTSLLVGTNIFCAVWAMMSYRDLKPFAL